MRASVKEENKKDPSVSVFIKHSWSCRWVGMAVALMLMHYATVSLQPRGHNFTVCSSTYCAATLGSYRHIPSLTSELQNRVGSGGAVRYVGIGEHYGHQIWGTLVNSRCSKSTLVLSTWPGELRNGTVDLDSRSTHTITCVDIHFQPFFSGRAHTGVYFCGRCSDSLIESDPIKTYTDRCCSVCSGEYTNPVQIYFPCNCSYLVFHLVQGLVSYNGQWYML